MRKNLPLIVGFGLPVLLIVAVILSIYLPRLYTDKPKHNFLFMNRGDYNYGYFPPNPTKADQTPPPPLYEYTVKDDRLQLNQVNVQSGRGYEKSRLPTVYLYNVKSNTYTTVNPDQVSAYKIISAKTSPDGYKLTQGGGGDTGAVGFFFGGGRSYDYNSIYLTKNSYSQKLNLPANVSLGNCSYYYSSLMDCGFAGWVVEGGAN